MPTPHGWRQLLQRRLPDKLLGVKRANVSPPKYDHGEQGLQMLKRLLFPRPRAAFVVSRSVKPGHPAAGLRLVVALIVSTFVGMPACASGKGPADLAARMDALLRQAPLARASVGVYVERASDGRAIYAHGADRLLIPASNQKILTALASLERFGPTHRFSTRILAPQAIDAEGMVSELIVEGGGDPVMNSEDWWRLAADLRGAGLRGVRGDLRVDDRLFDGPGWHPSWGNVTARAYHAPIGALTANYGTFFVSIWPQAAVGSAALVDVDPPVDYLRLRNQAKTGRAKTRARVVVDRIRGRQTDGPAEEIIRVSGVARQGASVDRFPRSVLDPGLYAGSLLAYQLEANGIDLEGDVRRAPQIESESFQLVLDRPGRTVAEAVGLCLKYSNNSIAESLVKSLAAWEGASLEERPVRQGNWVDGIRALRVELGRLGVDLAGAKLIDGSGLSIQNRLAPRMLVSALAVGRASFRSGPEFVAALPIARTDGTLKKRIRQGRGRIRAKTGLLSDAAVTSLSGYAEREDGETWIFSILVNGHSGGSAAAMDAVDRLAQTLLDFASPASIPAFDGKPVSAASLRSD
ncbi:MAG TPA: D-alanyl-D-alanine carboxypeptidase/D-alanyl-D-alanine-endopeptidase [Myxococcales bacterium]|nr:D-alanyl-D-alanine carboxypeptidase/D-alanyl-D-alanine-endopeptidase [Myxococcales bacterium]HIK86840.1 D-alanyl-D-alanine carboxypeptidase/D-alanyl-D-alanine-endopeptidase [Myxococcales bacterium]